MSIVPSLSSSCHTQRCLTPSHSEQRHDRPTSSVEADERPPCHGNTVRALSPVFPVVGMLTHLGLRVDDDTCALHGDGGGAHGLKRLHQGATAEWEVLCAACLPPCLTHLGPLADASPSGILLCIHDLHKCRPGASVSRSRRPLLCPRLNPRFLFPLGLSGPCRPYVSSVPPYHYHARVDHSIGMRNQAAIMPLVTSRPEPLRSPPFLHALLPTARICAHNYRTISLVGGKYPKTTLAQPPGDPRPPLPPSPSVRNYRALSRLSTDTHGYKQV